MGNHFTRRARFGKTVEAAGRTLIGKQGEELFFFGDHGPRTNVISDAFDEQKVKNIAIEYRLQSIFLNPALLHAREEVETKVRTLFFFFI